MIEILKNNLTKIWTFPNKNILKEGDVKHTLGSSMEISSKIRKYNPILRDTFIYAIGPGLQKVIFHLLMSTKSEVGFIVEKDTSTNYYSNLLWNSLDTNKNIRILEGNFKEIFGILLLNNLKMKDSEVYNYFKACRPNVIIFTFKEVKNEKYIEKIELEDENKNKFYGYLYRKPYLENGLVSRFGIR